MKEFLDFLIRLFTRKTTKIEEPIAVVEDEHDIVEEYTNGNECIVEPVFIDEISTEIEEDVIVEPEIEEQVEEVNEELSDDRKQFLAEVSYYKENKDRLGLRIINEIAVHCTATNKKTTVTMEKLDIWHKARGFSKQAVSGHYCGYHFVINQQGKIMFGRKLQEVGAHVTGFNAKSIGLCYVGGLNELGQGEDTRTEEQKDTLVWCVSVLKRELGITKVQGHRDYSPDKNKNGKIEPNEWIKLCPCFDAIPEYQML